MQLKRKNSILVIIVVLLLIMTPLTILSIYLNFSNILKPSSIVKPSKEQENENKEEIVDNSRYKNGKLYFYDQDNNLLGEYTCQKDPCSYAVSTIDDSNYAIEYLDTKEVETNVYLNQYVFINDNDTINLYDINNNQILNTYKAIKNYNNMIDESYMIVENNDNKWGIIKLDNQVQTISDFNYDFIGLKDLIGNNNLIDTSNFIVKNGDLWGIIDNQGDLISNFLAGEITNYNDILISVKNNNIYYLYDYNGKRVVDENGFNYTSFTDKYINIIDKNNNLYIYDYVNDKKISSNMKIEGTDYKNSFESVLNSSTNTIDVTVNNKTYNYSL